MASTRGFAREFCSNQSAASSPVVCEQKGCVSTKVVIRSPDALRPLSANRENSSGKGENGRGFFVGIP